MHQTVTVIIATFNSSAFVKESLNSIYNQKWKDIELVITDDNSTDNTLEICHLWLKENNNRFRRSQVITSEINTGVPANANRGLRAAKGEWIKFLGADDTLKPTCIEDNMLWVSSHPETRVLFSRIEVYKDTFEPNNILTTTPVDPYSANSILAWSRSPESQYRMLLVSDRIHFTPSVFIHYGTLLSVGGFDERFRFLEDYPLWLNLTKNGHKLYFMDRVTVNYRRHSQAINNTGRSFLINPSYYRAEPVRRLYTYPFLPPLIRGDQKFRWIMSRIFKIDILNRQGRFNGVFLNLLTVYLNPFRYMIKLRKIVIKDSGETEFYC